MERNIPPKLQRGDVLYVVAPSDSLHVVSAVNRSIAITRLKELGFALKFGAHVEESNTFCTCSVEARVADLHEAFRDDSVAGILAVKGGFSCNQILTSLDWALIQKHPKVLCGYSDITALSNALYAEAGLVSYSGPAFADFSEKDHFDYTLKHWQRCVMEEGAFVIEPSPEWSDDPWYEDQSERHLIPNDGPYCLCEGEAFGTILGGNMCTFNLLHGTRYMPALADSILFLEDDDNSDGRTFDRDLQSLILQPGFAKVRGLVIGRFQKGSDMTRHKLELIIHSKPELAHIPVIADADFGHTDPMFTFPIGGKASIVSMTHHTEIKISVH